jgi:hypothetical protein
MSYCITINGLELLPAEETLLIHYNITCTGTWYLQQLSTAYRNVCDTEWTVMYPNHQHPRHSDFPITVPQAPQAATFAWNYGGIQGISSENFDATHSYLVQLAIFNYECFNTGQPTTGDPGTGTGTTGTGTTGTTTGEPPGPPFPPLIAVPGTPIPGFPSHPIPGRLGKPNPDSSEWPDVSIVTYPDTSNPGEPNPNATQLPGFPSDPGEPGGGIVSNPEPGEVITQPEIIGNPNIYSYSSPYPKPTPNIPPSSLGNQAQNLKPTITRNGYSNPAISFTRPSEYSVGASQNPNLSFRSTTRSDAIPGEASYNIGLPQPNSKVNANTVNESNEGNIPGMLSSKLLGSQFVTGPKTKQLNISSLEYSSYVSLMVSSDIVTIGQPIVISAVFSPNVEMKAKMRVTIQDSHKSKQVVSTDLIDVSSTVPLTCGQSTLSSIYNLGNLVVTCIVEDIDNKVIGVKSVAIANIEEVNSGNIQNSKATISYELPSLISNHGNMHSVGVDLDVANNVTKYVLLNSTSSITSLSCVFQTNDTKQSSYGLAAYVPLRPATEFTLSGEFTEEQSAAYSDTRYKINNEEVYPYTHVAGISNQTIVPSYNIALEISPLMPSLATKGKLYFSKALALKEASGSATASTVTAYLPYGLETYGLILNGKASGQVPSNYSDNIAVTNSLGEASWSGVTLNNNDYYSIVKSINGRINPFIAPTYIGRYTV